MIQSIDQLEPGLRIKTLKEAVLACRARQEQVKQEEAEYLDKLAQAEASVAGYEGYELSGLIEDNPYSKETEQPQPEEQQAEGEQRPEQQAEGTPTDPNAPSTQPGAGQPISNP